VNKSTEAFKEGSRVALTSYLVKGLKLIGQGWEKTKREWEYPRHPVEGVFLVHIGSFLEASMELVAMMSQAEREHVQACYKNLERSMEA
jgi:hypothetical protein